MNQVEEMKSYGCASVTLSECAIGQGEHKQRDIRVESGRTCTVRARSEKASPQGASGDSEHRDANDAAESEIETHFGPSLTIVNRRAER